MSDLISRDAAKSRAVCAIHFIFDNDDLCEGTWVGKIRKRLIAEVEAALDTAAAGEQSEVRKLIDDYKTSLAQGVSKSDTGEEMLGLVIEDLEKIASSAGDAGEPT